jgi:hypothetical protein
MRLHKHVGQAVVEFALASTLILFLIAAAVDLGFIFFAMQGLHSAAQEGAVFGAVPNALRPDGSGVVAVSNNSGSAVAFQNANAIRDRTRKEAGTATGSIGGINLLDLNANGVLDDTEPSVIRDYIDVQLVLDNDTDGLVDTSSPNCPDASVTANCFLLVTVRAEYKPFFPVVNTLMGRSTIRLSSSYFLPFNRSYERIGESITVLTEPMCRFPTLIGQTRTQATQNWTNAGMTGSLTFVTNTFSTASSPIVRLRSPDGAVAYGASNQGTIIRCSLSVQGRGN